MDKVILFLARGCGSGLLHPAPGTWGSLAAFLIGVIWSWFFGGIPLWFIVIAGLLGVYICDSGEKQLAFMTRQKLYLMNGLVCGLPCGGAMVLTPVAFLLFRFSISASWGLSVKFRFARRLMY